MSGITFKHGTALYIATDTHKYKFYVSDVSANQTFVESRQVVRTLHDRALRDKTFVTEKSPVSVDFSVYLGTGQPEKTLAEWFDLPFVTSSHKIPTSISLSATPTQYDLYLVSGNTTYKIAGAVAENLSLSISQKNILSGKVTATGTDLEDVTSNTTEFDSLIEVAQNTSQFLTSSVIVTGVSNVLGVTLEITRGIAWRNLKSVFDIGSIYKVSKPTIAEMSVSGSVTVTKLNNNNIIYTPSTSIGILYGPSFAVSLGSCSVTERFDLGDYHRVVSDFVLLPSNTNSTIKF